MRSKVTRLEVVCLICLFGLSLQAQDAGSVWSAKKSSWLLLTAPQRQEVGRFAEEYKSYLSVAKSALTSTREVIRLAKAAGFAEFTDPAQVKPGARLIIPDRQRAVILAVIGSEPMVDSSRLVGAHHDSNHLDLKARPVVAGDHSGVALFKTVYYGGLKKYQWSNLPLALIGKIDTADGRSIDVSIGFKPDDPVFVIADNAPHSDEELRNRTYNTVLKGEEMDPVAGSVPGESASVVAEVIRELTSRYKVREEDFVSSELHLVPVEQPRDVGVDHGLIGAYGQDDRLSSYCAIRAVMDLKGTPHFTAMAYLSNFEEVGSVNNTGARSQFLNTSYARLVGAQQGEKYSDLDLRRALHNAEVISADTNDGINPIFGTQSSEESNAARVGYGVAIKKYGRGFDANSEYTARIIAVMERDGIPWQTQTPKVDVGGGGTIGGFMSQEDMEVIDLGVPLLSMHAPFEMSSKVDVWNFYRCMLAFLGS